MQQTDTDTPQTVWAGLTLRAPSTTSTEDHDKKHRDKVDMCAVVDCSGSMRGEKLNHVKKALTTVVEECEMLRQNMSELSGLFALACILFAVKDGDRLSVVPFDSAVRDSEVLQLTNMDEVGKDDAKRKIESITDGSQTNLCAGLCRGI